MKQANGSNSGEAENVEKQNIYKKKSSNECDRIHRCLRTKKEVIEIISAKILFKLEAIFHFLNQILSVS
jgi:hypothetical protein